MQYLPSTWRAHSVLVYGEVREMTDVRERFVATKIVERWVNAGYNAAQIALMWNQGHAGQCKSGVNKYGVKYDSCGYRDAVLAYLRR